MSEPMTVVFTFDPDTGNINHQITNGIPIGVMLMMALLLERAANSILDNQVAANQKPKLAIARSMPPKIS